MPSRFRPVRRPQPPDNLTVETVASGLPYPWAIAFLPDGRMLVTERAGRLRIVGKGRQRSRRRLPACRRCSRAARAACTT